MSLQLHIVTPSRNMLSVICEDVVLPGYDGELGILPEHAEFVNRLGAGILQIRGAKSETLKADLKSDGASIPTKLAISGGVAEIAENKITVLADEAFFPSEIDLKKLDAAQQQLSQEIMNSTDETIDREKLFTRQRWISVQRDLISK